MYTLLVTSHVSSQLLAGTLYTCTTRTRTTTHESYMTSNRLLTINQQNPPYPAKVRSLDKQCGTRSRLKTARQGKEALSQCHLATQMQIPARLHINIGPCRSSLRSGSRITGLSTASEPLHFYQLLLSTNVWAMDMFRQTSKISSTSRCPH